MRHTLTALSLLLLASSAVAQQGYSAKSLFFGEDDSLITAPTGLKPSLPASPAKTEPVAKKSATSAAYKKPAATKQIGASYFIRLKNADGSSRDVLVSRKFKTGERFQLGVKVSSPGYVYILSQEPNGKIIQIYPQPGRDNFINAMGTVFLPSQGSFEFDNQPGVEQLLVYLSPTQIDDKISERVRESNPDMISTFVDVAAIPAECAQVQTAKTTAPGEWQAVESAVAEPRYASKGISFSDDAVPVCENGATKPSAGYASKGISFSDDAEPGNGGQVASYVVKNASATTDKSLYLKLKLVHE
jgi:hypothetical protein